MDGWMDGWADERGGMGRLGWMVGWVDQSRMDDGMGG